MNKGFIVSLLAALILASVYPIEAGQAKVYRIGVLYPGGPLSTTIDGLRGGLSELGLAEGKQFTLAILDTKGEAKAAGRSRAEF